MRAMRDIFADLLILRGFSVIGVTETEVQLSHPNVTALKYVLVNDSACFLYSYCGDGCITVNLFCGYIEGQANGLCDMFGV